MEPDDLRETQYLNQGMKLFNPNETQLDKYFFSPKI